jgi:hypothetical protein
VGVWRGSRRRAFGFQILQGFAGSETFLQEAGSICIQLSGSSCVLAPVCRVQKGRSLICVRVCRCLSAVLVCVQGCLG